MPHRSGTLQLLSVMFLTRDLTVSVLSRVVSHDINNISAMTARIIAMSVLLRSNNNCCQVLVLAVANRYFRLVSTTHTVVVQQIGRAHNRK
jgi:hypothetical protein